jgi:acyl-CoA synthetase (AMP-forming)/AMP-acid ligase II
MAAGRYLKLISSSGTVALREDEFDGPHMTPDFPRLNDYVDWYARTTPQTLAIAGRERLSYLELQKQVRACADALAGCGVGPGDCMATLSTPGGAFLVSFLASALLGAIWVGLNPRHTAAELDAAVAALSPRVIFARKAIETRNYESWISALPHTIATCVISDGSAAALADFAGRKRGNAKATAAHAAPDAPALIVFTSGSSGRPKGAMISQRALVGASQVQLAQWPVNPLRVLNNLPINHIGCVGDLCCYALVGGGTNVFSERFDPADSIALCERERVTMLGQVPTQFLLTLNSPQFRPEALTSLQLIIWGGAQASAELVAALRDLGKPVATSYGQTESVGSVTFTPPDATLEELTTTVGRPVAPYAVRIVAENGDVAAASQPGEIHIRSPFCMHGYWRDPEATERAFTPDGWLRTGDIGAVAENGMLRLIGRTTETFKSGGYNIYPIEIEQAIASHAAVADAAVVSLIDPLFGMVGAAMVQPQPGQELTAAALRTYLADRVANYKIPKRILIAAELPKLPVGKIDKTAVREILAHVGEQQ